MNTKSRNSSLELLKIVAIVMIVFSHSVPSLVEGVVKPIGWSNYLMDLSVPTVSIQRLLIVLFRYGGQIGNAIFVVCSAYFLLESKKVNINKAMQIIADTIMISVIWLIVISFLGYDLSKSEIIKQFIPITMQANWFVGCYLLLFFIHPALNMVIEKLNKEKLLIVNIILFVLYCGINTLSPGKYYYTPLIGFVCIYFFVAYIKKYLDNSSKSMKLNVSILIISLCGLCLLILMTNLLGLLGIMGNGLTRWCQFINPFIILIALSVFNLARNHHFVNKKVNYLASISLLVYIFHENVLVREHLRYDIFKFMFDSYTYNYVLLVVIAVAILQLFFGISLSILYKETIQKIMFKFCNLLIARISKICDRFIQKLMKFT